LTTSSTLSTCPHAIFEIWTSPSFPGRNSTKAPKLMSLVTDGMLVKRPILINGEIVLVGFKEKEWEEKIKAL
jgi:hypothetical protein